MRWRRISLREFGAVSVLWRRRPTPNSPGPGWPHPAVIAATPPGKEAGRNGPRDAAKRPKNLHHAPLDEESRTVACEACGEGVA